MDNSKKSSCQSQTEDDNKSRFKKCCPLKLNDYPTGICNLGLQKAQWYKDNPGHMMSEDINSGGCVWGIISEDESSYCFFKFMNNHENESFSESDIAKRLGITKEQVKAAYESGIEKLKKQKNIQEIMDTHKKYGGILTEDTDDDYIYFPVNSVTEGFLPSTSEEEIDESLISQISGTSKKKAKKKK
jgi:hypothetical protein